MSMRACVVEDEALAGDGPGALLAAYLERRGTW